jgi:hypothetical protein
MGDLNRLRATLTVLIAASEQAIVEAESQPELREVAEAATCARDLALALSQRMLVRQRSARRTGLLA